MNNLNSPTKQKKRKNLATFFFFLFLFSFILLLFFNKQFDILQKYSYLNFLKAFLEAGLIGALADWFAVFAIFKKPFNLNIPHTNLISKNKEKMANGIANFVVLNFLDENKILKLINSKSIQLKLYQFLIQPKTQKTLIDFLKQKQLFELIKKEVDQKISGEIVAKKLAKELILLKENNLKTLLRTQMFKIKNELNSEKTKSIIEDKVRSLVKKEQNTNNSINGFFASAFSSLKKDMLDLAEPKITSYLIDFANNYLEQNINDIENSIFYKRITFKVDQLIYLLNSSKRVQNKIENKIQILNEDDFYQFIEDKYFNMVRNKNTLKSLNFILNKSISILINKKDYIKKYIVDTIMQWNEKELSNNIEDNVYDDLQYIRINGTLVGGLIGVIIYSISLLF